MTPATAPLTQEFQNRAIREIVQSLQNLPPARVAEVQQFVKFLEYQLSSTDDLADDLALWDAVEANRDYKCRNPDEEMERYESGTEFLKALADL